MVTIAADAMTAEGGIETLVNGAKMAVDENKDISIILVGDEILLKQAVDSYEKISTYPASQVVGMQENPLNAVKTKPDSTVSVAAQLVKDNKADIMVSAGNTGASIAAAYFKFGRLDRVKAVPVVVRLPTINENEYTAFLDAGVNKEHKPKHLIDFAIMGYEFAKYVMKIENPRVGLLNMGKEPDKGPAHLTKINNALRDSEINYIGFIEGGDTRNGGCDVAVISGFAGNIILKVMEVTHEVEYARMKKACMKDDKRRKAFQILREDGLFDELRDALYSESQGGGYVIGLKKPLIITHGAASEKAIKKAFLFAKECHDSNLPKMNSEIEREIAKTSYPIFP